MSIGKMVLYTALGAAAVSLLSTDKAKEWKNELTDQTLKNVKKWQERLGHLHLGR